MLSTEYYGNTLENWLIAIAIIVISVVLARVVYWIFRRVLLQFTSKTETKIDDIILAQSRPPLLLAIMVLGFRIAYGQLHFPIHTQVVFQRASIIITVLLVTWFLSRVVSSLINEYFKNENTPGTRDTEKFSPILKRVVTGVIWTIGLITGLNNAGMDVGALLAGLGIGGLAVALASQDTVKNMIGGLIILFDKPFRIGDRIQVDNNDGIVEDIGLRSTKLRNHDGFLVTMPNSVFSDKTITNVSQNKFRRILCKIGFAYANSSEVINDACRYFAEMIESEPGIIPNTTSVFISQFGPRKLEVTISTRIADSKVIAEVQHAIMQNIFAYCKSNKIRLDSGEEES